MSTASWLTREDLKREDLKRELNAGRNRPVTNDDVEADIQRRQLDLTNLTHFYMRDLGDRGLRPDRRSGGCVVKCTARSIEIWGSILDYFFINHTLTRARWPDVPPFRSHRQPAVLLSEAYSLHRIRAAQSPAGPRRRRAARWPGRAAPASRAAADVPARRPAQGLAAAAGARLAEPAARPAGANGLSSGRRAAGSGGLAPARRRSPRPPRGLAAVS